MDEMAKLLYDTKRLMLLRYPRFGSEIASANIEYKSDLKYHTAATDGKNIYFDPEYLAKLSESDRLFLIAHELMPNYRFDLTEVKDLYNDTLKIIKRFLNELDSMRAKRKKKEIKYIDYIEWKLNYSLGDNHE